VLNYVFYACFVMLVCFHVFHCMYELLLILLILYGSSNSVIIVIKCFNSIKMHVRCMYAWYFVGG
jgi:hypothetical protein